MIPSILTVVNRVNMKFRFSVLLTVFEFFYSLASILLTVTRVWVLILTMLQSMMEMDQETNQLKLQCLLEIWEYLTFQALEIPYLSNLNQIIILIMADFMQQSIIVIHI